MVKNATDSFVEKLILAEGDLDEIFRLRAVWFGGLRELYAKNLPLSKTLVLWKTANSEFSVPAQVEERFKVLAGLMSEGNGIV